MNNNRFLGPLFWGIIFILVSCASEPPKPSAPEWTQQPTRVVDNGYIVYVESESGPNEDKAKIKAEGLALADLSNECSFVPKGTRLEDRYVEQVNSGVKTYVKVALEFQECSEAQKASDPDSIRRLASESFMQTLKSYQDYEETGEFSSGRELIDAEAVADLPPAPSQQSSPDNVHFYVLRQYVAYQKEVVILSPRTSFAPNSPESQTFSQNVSPAVQRIGVIQEAQPNLAKQPVAWSKIPDRPKFQRPAVLVKRPSFKALNIPRRPQPAPPNYRNNGRKNQYGSRRGNKNYPSSNKKEKENRD